MKRIILLTLGSLALLLGAVGVLLPVLPTTPFVLCAAGCFGASSPALYRRLERSRYFGEYVRNYKSGCGISRAARRSGLIFLWLTLTVSAILSGNPKVWLVLGLVGIAVTIHLVTIKRKPK